jgi:hypothetical protein
MAEAAPQNRFQRFIERLITRPAPAPAAARDTSFTASPGSIQGRPSFDLGGLNALGPWSHIPVPSNFPLYERLKESVPLIDAAIVHITELVGTPCIEAEDDVKQEIDDWLWQRLRVNQVQVGLGNFISTWLDDMLTYGRSHAEIVLTNRRDDIYGLFELHPGTIAFKQTGDGYTVDTVQLGRPQPLIFPAWKIMNAVNRVRTDDPNGTSLMWGLSIVAECYVAMVRSQQGLYTRFGDPSYHVNVEPPDGLNDPNGAIMGRLIGTTRTSFMDAIAARKNGTTKDFFSGGKVTVSVIGAAGEELQFSQSAVEIVDQIVAKTGLPPMIFGLSRATTERMSTVQSSLLAEMVDRLQQTIEPEIRRLITLRQALRGDTRDWNLKWDSANLQDRLQDAQADMQEEQAQTEKWTNWNTLWKTGLVNTFQVAREFVPELSELSDEEIATILKAAQEKADRLLPDITPTADPAPLPGLPGFKPGQGNGGQPGMNQGAGNNRAPQAQRSLSYSSHWDEPPTNGNGHR